MKAIGIAVVMAQCGLFVPAVSMQLCPFEILATRILNHDNIAQGMSSFTVEMSELREVLRVANSRTLILGDEVCAGTENISGTAIVASSIEYLLEKKSKFIFATHLHDLQKCDVIHNDHLGIYHLKVENKNGLLIYHRTLLPGGGATTYGLEVAQALHIPFEVIEKAHAIRQKLLGENPKKSHWNSSHYLRSCERCGKKTSLEAHHIQERAFSENGTTTEGLSVHDLRNLVTLCDSCHDAHHANKIEVGEVLLTDKGPIRNIQEVEKKKRSSTKQMKYTEDELKTILQCIDENPGINKNLLVVKLARVYGIKITVNELMRQITFNAESC